MRIAECNWMQLEQILKVDDRCVLPLGSTEQHAFLSLSSDSLLAERMAIEAAEPLGVPVFPVLPFGVTPQFTTYPGTVSLSLAGYTATLCEILSNLERQGFRRIMVLNGHGGNAPAAAAVVEWASQRDGTKVKWHDWWRGPKAWAKVRETDPNASHASWMENFPWTRLAGVELPTEPKPMIDMAPLRFVSAEQMRRALGDGSFGGLYQRSDEEMHAIWQAAIAETREMLVGGW